MISSGLLLAAASLKDGLGTEKSRPLPLPLPLTWAPLVCAGERVK